jgi:hypothetical protein
MANPMVTANDLPIHSRNRDSRYGVYGKQPNPQAER